MRPTRRTVLRSVATSGIGLGLAGCTDGGGGATATETGMGGGSPTGTGMATETPTGTGTEGSTGASVQVRSHSDLDDILVGPKNMTLYMFEKDSKGETASTCYDDCAKAWPPLIAESPTKSKQVTATLSTFKRKNGDVQVAANGWPLYYFKPDMEPGDANGQGVDGFGGLWWVLGPDGTPKKSKGTTTGTGTETGGTATDTDGY